MSEVTREEFDQLVETVEKLALIVNGLADVTGGIQANLNMLVDKLRKRAAYNQS